MPKSFLPMHLPKLSSRFVKLTKVIVTVLVVAGLIAGSVFAMQMRNQWVAERTKLLADKASLEEQLQNVSAKLTVVTEELDALKTEDQVVKNKQLQEEIKNIQSTFSQSLKAYEGILDVRGDGGKVDKLEDQFSLILTQLSKRNYASASTTLSKLNQDIQAARVQLASNPAAIPENVKKSNSPPGATYVKQVVQSDAGEFLVDILGADLNNTRVQVETASEGNCADNCPVAALADFVARSGGFAGINGPYFCPASYPSCAGKTNSFDTLIMNKNKVYFNSDNNVYSVVPAFIFSGGGARLVNSSDAGRDTGVDAVIAAQPALIRNGEVAFGGDDDPKKGSRGSRSFIAVKGNMVYIGVVRNATVAEVARVMKALGMDNALNLDSGGSTAFMVNGRYIAGPGRATPFGIILVRK